MKKLILTTFVLTITFILASCGTQGQKNFKNSSDAVESFQKAVKKVDSHSIKSENQTTLKFQNKKTTFKQISHGRTNHHDKMAFNISQKSNNKSFKTNNKSIFIDSNEMQSSPKAHYLNFNAQQSEIDYYQKLGQDWFDFTEFNQGILKPIENDITINDRTLSYDGNNKVMKRLYELGFNQSPLADQESLSQISNLKIKEGKFNLTLQQDKALPKQLTFGIVATGKIKNETVTIHMKQTTDYYKYNHTDVHPYKNLINDKYK